MAEFNGVLLLAQGLSAGQVGLLAGVALISALMGMGFVQGINYLRKRDADKMAREIIDRAEMEATGRRKEAEVEAKEIALREKSRVEEEANKVRGELHERERHLDKREDSLEQRGDQLSKQEKMVEGNQRRLAEKLEDAARRQKELDDLLDVERQTLHRLSGLSEDDARTQLLERMDKELAHEQGALIMKQQKAVEQACDAKAKELLITSIQRFAASHTAEATTNTVDIPNDEMKGRIIGREGRNIRSFEKATGVDVIIDDTPGVVIVSAFDPVRREIARQSLVKLIADGRIHPAASRRWSGDREGDRRQAPRARRGGHAGGFRPRPARQGHHAAGAPALPHQLQPERAAALDRGGVRFGHDRRGAGHGRRPGPPRRPAARHRQGRGPRRGGRATPRSAPTC